MLFAESLAKIVYNVWDMTSETKIYNRDTDVVTLAGEAKGVFDASGLVVFPTETVYGIGASVGSAEGIANLRKFKSREDMTPFTLHMYCAEQAVDFIGDGDGGLLLMVRKLLPGLLLVLLM